MLSVQATIQFESFKIEADFTVQPHERLALKGPSGSGKSTLLRVISGLPVGAQQVQIQASLTTASNVVSKAALNQKENSQTQQLSDYLSLPPEQREIGYLFQNPTLFTHLTVEENIIFPFKMKKIPQFQYQPIVDAWLDRIQLKSHAHQNVSVLSGGEQQRVAFARAMAWSPRLLLLDEPFSALDLSLRNHLRKELVAYHQELKEEHKVPLIFVTHDAEDCDIVATRTIECRVLENGRVRQFS